MIACRHDLRQDVDALVDALARERRALVPTEALRSRLGWDDDRFADVVAEAEDGLPVADGQKTTLRLVCPETRRLGRGLAR